MKQRQGIGLRHRAGNSAAAVGNHCQLEGILSDEASPASGHNERTNR
ncbi:MAG TPA: hypothetical protein P5307_09350 [Pirellulaceae bacterium]|nr:hypothetical protein [Pirellulaceae bacterium]